jgi:catechol 2,3-dioxygenase-like lactoylglutathione lyase family enzyme
LPATVDLGLLRLAHVALTSPDPERLAVYYERNVGLAPAGAHDGTLLLTTDDHHHCLELSPGDAPTLDHVAFEVRDLAKAMDALASGSELSVAELESPGYARALAFEDPEGNTIRLVCGPERSAAIDPASRTFRPRKLGHIGVCATNLKALSAFYTGTIGFRLSDWIGEQVVFLRCNPDHHALVFVAEPAAGSAMHHVAFEVQSWEGFARQADLLAADGIAIGWGPGRHAPSRNYFMYFDDGDGNRIEWMAGVRQIADDESHIPAVFDPSEPTSWNVWGVMPPPEFLKRIGPPALAAV